MAAMIRGVVKFFDAERGFGFVEPLDGGDDCFVHISAVRRSGLEEIVKGETLEFSMGIDPRNGKTCVEKIRAATG
jgi:cold shock protein